MNKIKSFLEKQAKGSTKVACPNCNSFKTFNPRGIYIAGGIITALLSIPWMFVLIGIPFFIVGILVMLAGFAQPKGIIKCRQCDNKWVPNPKE